MTSRLCIYAVWAIALGLFAASDASAQCPNCPPGGTRVILAPTTEAQKTAGELVGNALYHNDGKVYLKGEDGVHRECPECTAARGKIKLIGKKPGCNCYPCECNK